MSDRNPANDVLEAQSKLSTLQEQIVACKLCPRLVEHRERVGEIKRRSYLDWVYWSRPLPGFGDPAASLVIVGLAPAAHGGNRTGRVFTGDATANFLMAALHRTGFANQPTSQHVGDGLQLADAYISAAVRCVPPGDRPTTEEQWTCLPYLTTEIQLLPRVRAVLALGRIAFQACLRALRQPGGARLKGTFGHGVRSDLGPGLPTLFSSYHPSPRNTNTGRLSPEGLLDVMRDVRRYLYLDG